MYGHHIHQSMDQPGKVTPGRSQLNSENMFFSVPVVCHSSTNNTNSTNSTNTRGTRTLGDNDTVLIVRVELKF